MKKFELTNNKKMVKDKVVYQIKALKDFANIKKGELGGWVESIDNLSQFGQCWIYKDSVVLGKSVVSGCATVDGDITVEDSYISDNAHISSNGKISECYIYGNTKIKNSNIRLSNNVKIHGNTFISKTNFEAFDSSEIFNTVFQNGKIRISGGAKIIKSSICCDASIFGKLVLNNMDAQDAKSIVIEIDVFNIVSKKFTSKISDVKIKGDFYDTASNSYIKKCTIEDVVLNGKNVSINGNKGTVRLNKVNIFSNTKIKNGVYICNAIIDESKDGKAVIDGSNFAKAISGNIWTCFDDILDMTVDEHNRVTAILKDKTIFYNIGYKYGKKYKNLTEEELIDYIEKDIDVETRRNEYLKFIKLAKYCFSLN